MYGDLLEHPVVTCDGACATSGDAPPVESLCLQCGTGRQ